MPILVQCPACAKKLRAPDNMAGKLSQCPSCKEKLTVPRLISTAPAPDVHPNPPQALAPPSVTRKPEGSATESESDSYAVADAPSFAPRVEPAQRPNSNWKAKDPHEHVPATVSKRPALKPANAKTSTSDVSVGQPAASSKSVVLAWLFACTLIPLALSIFSGESDLKERFMRTFEAHPEVLERVGEEGITKEALLSAIPDHRIDGAHLAHDSWMHWFYALLAAGLFLAAIPILFDAGKANIGELILAGVITATVGIFMLICFQWIAEFTQGMWIKGRSVLVILFYIIKLIGFSYRAAVDESNGFWLSFFGFTLGVGLCEELTKAVPVLVHLRGSSDQRDWRSACVWGLASGVGFGVAEGIMYSSSYYNGMSTGGIYFVRFISCVGLHAIWSASAGLMIWHNQGDFEGDLDWMEWTIAMFKVLGVPMVLHGLYDTLLKKEMNAWALGVAAVSFLWLMWLVHRSQNAAE